ncbi:sulfotransferase family protein [Mameliella alba]|uniref:sulfotransferase family protein n=1 Tax=Mameliella alba TaxID=561184 RepID=UPI000B52A32C|nr:sulfotransferase family protein [Mameliella alba]MBY6119354.1 sulfotransferase family protein [Mameliella alba]OWV45002.1 sulfotransferase family protein [Mameliella alba]OWV66652.1 sulfotransferase family protein [Mameliella alba]
MSDRTVKLVNLGLPKTGTTTLAHALNEGGWRAADHKVRRVHCRTPGLGGTSIARQLYNGYFETGDPFAHLDGLYDALTEISMLNPSASLWPQCDYAMIKAMRLARPDMLFVATWRPSAEISDSMRRWGNLGQDRLPGGAIPGLPQGYGANDDQRIRWIEGHYAMLRDLFGEDPRFLELPVGAADARQRLSAHLRTDLPWWGRLNKNPETGTTGKKTKAGTARGAA